MKALGYVEDSADKLEHADKVNTTEKENKGISQTDNQGNVITTTTNKVSDTKLVANNTSSTVKENNFNNNSPIGTIDHKTISEKQANDLPQTGEQNNFVGAILGAMLTVLGALGTIATFHKKRS